MRCLGHHFCAWGSQGTCKTDSHSEFPLCKNRIIPQKLQTRISTFPLSLTKTLININIFCCQSPQQKHQKQIHGAPLTSL